MSDLDICKSAIARYEKLSARLRGAGSRNAQERGRTTSPAVSGGHAEVFFSLTVRRYAVSWLRCREKMANLNRSRAARGSMPNANYINQ
jgi:hypothetical protein